MRLDDARALDVTTVRHGYIGPEGEPHHGADAYRYLCLDMELIAIDRPVHRHHSLRRFERR